ncbi:MAG: nuclear transport factor 2 family protein [Actinomycetota bacterium]
MATGVVKWFDPATAEGAIGRRGRELPVRAEDMEPSARVAGARVRFDVARERGFERAVDVRLREGTRVSRRQHRFGDLVGAGHPDEAGRPPLTHGRPDPVRPAVHPMQTARRWVAAMEAGDLVGALACYAENAVLHVGAATHVGPNAIRGVLEGHPLFQATPGLVVVHGEGATILVRWSAGGPDVPGGETRLGVAHARILEQWIATARRPRSGKRGGPRGST